MCLADSESKNHSRIEKMDIEADPPPVLTAPHTEREVHHAPLFLFCGKTRREGIEKSVK